jgi:glutamate synthase domain-containing protein 1
MTGVTGRLPAAVEEMIIQETAMCGIVGVHLKSASMEHELGRLMVPMLEALTARGPDYKGIAVNRPEHLHREHNY